MSDAPDPVDVMIDAVSSAFSKAIGTKTLSQRCEHILDYLAEASTITTVKQLDALPTGSVVQDADKAWTRRPRSWWSLAFPHTAHDTPLLPALLLYHPAARHR
jgi:hypothetical protein